MATKTWNSSTNSTWNTAGNWSPSGVPGSSDDVVFGDSTHNGNCTVDVNVSVASLTINNTYTGLVDFGTTRTLTTTGDVTIDTGSTGATTTRFSANGLGGGLHYTIGGNLIVSTARKVSWSGTLDVTGNATFSGAGDRTFSFSTLNCVNYTNSGTSTAQIFGNINASGNFDSSSADAATAFGINVNLSGTTKTFSAKATQLFSAIDITGSYTFSQASGVGFNTQSFSVDTGGTFTNNVTETDGVIMQVMDVSGTYAGTGNQYLGTTGVVGGECTIDINGTWSNTGTTQVSWATILSSATTNQTLDGTWVFKKNGDFPGSETSVTQGFSAINLIFTGNVTIDCDDANTYNFVNFVTSIEFRGNLTLSNSGAGTFNYIKGTGTLKFTSGTATITLLNNTYENITITNTGTKTFTSATFTCQDLTLNGSAAITWNTTTINISGNFDATGYSTSAVQSALNLTLNLNGTGKTVNSRIAGGSLYGTVNVNGTYTMPSSLISFYGLNTVTCRFLSGGSLTNSNNLDVSSGLRATILSGANGSTYAGVGNFRLLNGTITLDGCTWSNTGTNTIGWTHTLNATSNQTLAGTWLFSKSGGVAGSSSSITHTLAGSNITFTGDVNFDCSEATTYNVTVTATQLEFKGNITFTNTGVGTLNYNKNTSGALLLSGTSGSQNVSLSGLSVEPITVNASGTTKTFTQSFTTPSLTVTAGNVTFSNSIAATVNGSVAINSTGTITLNSSTWAVSGGWDSSSATGLSAGTSAMTFSGSGSLQTNSSAPLVTTVVSGSYSIGSAGFAASTMSLSSALTANNALTLSGATFTVTSGGTLSGTGTVTLTNGPTVTNSGTWSHTGTTYLDKGGTLTSGNSTATFSSDFNFRQQTGTPTLIFGCNCIFNGNTTFIQNSDSNTFTININNKNLTFKGNVSISETSTGDLSWTKGTGTITINGNSAQDVDFQGKTIEDLVISNASSVTFLSSLVSDSINITAGEMIFNGKTITTTGDFTLTTPATIDDATLGGTTFTIGGNFTLTGSTTSILTLNPSSVWFLNVTGSGMVSYARVKNGNASGSTSLIYAPHSDSLGNNNNWDFPDTFVVMFAEQTAADSDATLGVALNVDITNISEGEFDLKFYGKTLKDTSYTLIGTLKAYAPEDYTFIWKGLAQGQSYQWYAQIASTSTEVINFNTAAAPIHVGADGVICKNIRGQIIESRSELVCANRAKACIKPGPAIVPAITICKSNLKSA